jgi:hypothetical protein
MKLYKLPAPRVTCELTRRVKIKRSPKPETTETATIRLNEDACVKFIGATIAMLDGMADTDTVRKAVRWWGETDKAWLPLKRLKKRKEKWTGT